jgi:cholesterol oxidase
VVFLSGDYHCSVSATITFSQSPVRAYALVAPPLHAPLRFANVAASDVLTAETVLLDSGHAQINARAFNGDGWLECELQSNASGRMVLRSEFRVHAIDAPMPELWSEAWELGSFHL